MAQLYDLEGRKLRLHFHPGQTRAWDSLSRFVFMIAGTQGGKTSFGPWWLNREIQRMGAGDYIAVTSSYDLFQLKMLPEMRTVFEEILKIGRYWSGSKVIELKDPTTGKFWAQRADDKMWGRIILRSANSPGGLESASAKAAWADEIGQDGFTLDSYEALLRRLALARGRLLGTTTPYNLGWLFQTVIVPWLAGDTSIDVISFSSIQNPSFPKEEYEERKKKMVKWKFEMFYDGQFTKPAGLIYEDFINKPYSEGGHIIPPPKINKNWYVHVGIDPGAVNLADCWVGYDKENDIYYVYRCEKHEKDSTANHARRSLKQVEEDGVQVLGWHIGTKGETQQRLDWENEGVEPVITPEVTDVESQIDRVIELFKTNRLLISSDCVDLIRDLGTYSREIDEMGEPTEVIANKGKFHRPDSLRYAISGAMSGEPTWEAEIA